VLDLKLVRERPDDVRAALARRGGSFPLDELVEVDARRRKLQTELDSMRAEHKALTKRVAGAPAGERDALLGRAKALSDEIRSREQEEDALAAELRRLLLEIPNLPHETVPAGETDDDNTEVRRWGTPPEFGFDPRDHLEIGSGLDVIDTERASRSSGARFAYLKGPGALLEIALVRFALDRLAPHGFTPVVPPVLVRRDAMEGTGFLPTDEQQIYRIADDDLYLVGTSEVPIAAMHAGEFLDSASLPVRYAGFSTCFRREAGAYGKDTRGIFRLHQFDKVEMFSFTLPEASWDEHDFLLERQEEILQALEIPYRVVNVCTGELGVPAAKKYDVEAWLPGQGAYREITSCSNCTDYQARRLSCRIKTDRGPAFVHTLNGTAVAVGRTLIAIIENHQQSDGSVRIPPALVSYTGFERIGP
jgi:seryl-tRNA synthetase